MNTTNALFNTLANNFSLANPIDYAILIVSGLILIASLISIIVSITLAIRYVRYNKKQNSCGLTGEEIARKILDMNMLNHIKVSKSGSLMFGNSYSHYFKKVRLRRRTWKKSSVASMAMAAQKSSLAVLDAEKDTDMVARVRMIPFMTFGPFAFIPMIIVGVVIDMIYTNQLGIATLIATSLGFIFYLLSFILSIKVLKTERKAQDRAIQIVTSNGMATQDEVEDMKHLFHLYNIEYINNMVLALLEMILRVLQIVSEVQNAKTSSK